MPRAYLRDSDFTLWHGGALETLRELPERSVDCCITSPPYWRLRDYGDSGQIGREPTQEEHVENLRAIFHEMKRVLVDTGTFWLNYGNSYNEDRNLANTAEKLMLALNIGWCHRATVIWEKPNAMPESATNRPGQSHEYVYLFTKTGTGYYYDNQMVLDEYKKDGRKKTTISGTRPGVGTHENYASREGKERWPGQGRALRSVWSIPTQPYPGSHFATFPEELVRRCLLLGCPETACAVCGMPSEHVDAEDGILVDPYGKRRLVTNGLAVCHHHSDHRRGTVLDPFMGSGTTALVARKNGRDAVGIEVAERFCALAAERNSQLSLLTAIADAEAMA